MVDSGAAWIWKRADVYCAGARQTLNDAHVLSPNNPLFFTTLVVINRPGVAFPIESRPRCGGIWALADSKDGAARRTLN